MRLDSVIAGLAMLTAGCGTGPSDTGGDPDTGEDIVGDTGGETGEEIATGRSGYEGELRSQGGTMEGSEEWAFVADGGAGDDLCRISYQLTATGQRDDCAACAWAFDLVTSGATLVAEGAPGCQDLAGVDPSDLSALDGLALSYGYAPEYMGHARMLMMDTGGGDWQAVGHATWDEEEETLSYERQPGYFDYPLEAGSAR